TISYATDALNRIVPGLFSPYYGILILPLHAGVTLWPVVFAQGALWGHLLYLIVRCVFGQSLAGARALFMSATLSLFSSLPWFTGQIMPDVFTPVLVCGMFLLAFCSDRLNRVEMVYIGALTTAAITTHLSHVPIALGLVLLCLLLRVFFAPSQS